MRSREQDDGALRLGMKTRTGFWIVVLFLSGLYNAVSTGAWAADLTNVRIKPQSNRTEVVLDLSALPEDLSVNLDNPAQVSLQFSGKVVGTVKGKSKGVPGSQNLKSVYWENREGKVQLFLKRHAPSETRVYMLKNPARLVVSMDKWYRQVQNRTVFPGVEHQHILQSTAHGPLNIHVISVDPQNPAVEIEPVLASSRVHGKAKVANMVKQHQALAGINAAFFKPDIGTNLGAVILNNELVSGPIYNRVAFGITDEKAFRMERITLGGKVITPSGKSIPLHNVNQPRLSKEQYVLYSPWWGRMAPKTPKEGIQIQIDEHQRVVAMSSDPLVIPEKGYVLIGPAKGVVDEIHPGDQLGIQVYTVPDWSNVKAALSGGPYLVKAGQIYVDTQAQSFRVGSFTRPAPRTAVGYTADNKLLMVTVDGRQKQVSAGVTLSEMARIMKSLGAVEAMNFDGGSSTQMVINGRIVNSPTVAGGAPVSSALLVRRTEPGIQQEVIGENKYDDWPPARF